MNEQLKHNLGIRVPLAPSYRKLLRKHWQGGLSRSLARASHSPATSARRRLVRVINKALNESLHLPSSVSPSPCPCLRGCVWIRVL